MYVYIVITCKYFISWLEFFLLFSQNMYLDSQQRSPTSAFKGFL